MYTENNYCVDRMSYLSYTAEEECVIVEKEQAITTYISEVQRKWLFGNESVEEGSDIYRDQLQAMGIDNLQAAY